MSVAARLVALIASVGLMGGCAKAMRNMYDQPRDKPFAADAFFADEQSARPPVAGVVAYSGGTLAGASSGRRGTLDIPAAKPTVAPAPAGVSGPWPPPLSGLPMPVSRSLIERGHERYDIYCAPCHGPLGDGEGMIVRRGFTAPPSYHNDRLRYAPDRHFYNVITSGYGAMFPYADRVDPNDRWAIVAYIRALQLSQHAPMSLLDPAEQQQLGAAPQ